MKQVLGKVTPMPEWLRRRVKKPKAGKALTSEQKARIEAHQRRLRED